MDTRRLALVVLLALVAAACGIASASPRDRAPSSREERTLAPAHPPASVQLVRRLDAEAAAVLPDVTGRTVRRAKAMLDGLTVKVVSFGSGVVSAQWPPAGDPRPKDGAVVVWVGAPPEAPRASAAADVVLEPVTEGEAPLLQPASSPAVSQPGGVTPGLDGFVPPPHPPRTNIRELAAARPGTVLAGRASWYGPGFAGHTTACGSVFDPAQHTLASRELRCGTKVTVTGPDGRTVDAVISDWGPAEWTDRRFDLSQATFAAVAGLGAGVVDVTVEVR